MHLSRFRRLALASWQRTLKHGILPTSFLLLGAPGTAKTSSARAVSEDMTELIQSKSDLARDLGLKGEAVCHIIDLTSSLPEDLGGVPQINPELREGIPQARYALDERLVDCMLKGRYGVLVLDDLPAASPAVQAAARKLVLDREIHGHKLAPGIVLITTGNRRSDKAGASTLPSHFLNSVCVIELLLGFDEWAKWYAEQGYLDPSVPAFLRTIKGSGHFSQLPSKANARGSFATPRSWTALGRDFAAAEATETLHDVALGHVGNSASEYIAFLRMRSQLARPADVLMNPKKALPDPKAQLDEPDKAIALVTGLAEQAIEWAQGEDKSLSENAYERFLLALAWTAQNEGDHFAMAIHHFASCGGDVTRLLPYVTKHKENPYVKSMFTRLHSVFDRRKSA